MVAYDDFGCYVLESAPFFQDTYNGLFRIFIS